MNNTKFSKAEIEKFVSESLSIADVCRKCGWKPCGGNYNTIKKYLSIYDIDVTHFTGQRSNICNKNLKQYAKNASEYLIIGSNISSSKLKYKLIQEGYKEYKCEKCGLTKWNNEQISLQLHHINGDTTDNRLENLQLLCPNCHSQTDNFCGYNNNSANKKYYCKNCGKEIQKTKTGYCNDCYEKLINHEDVIVKIGNKSVIVYGYCENCGVELHSKTKYGLCAKCANIIKNSKTKNRPSKEELLTLIKSNKSFVSIGKSYGVSDNAVRKWCKYYKLPYRKKDINN